MAVDEVALSIANNGFYAHEPLFAENDKGKLYVVEGNRRLAAVKLLRDAKLRTEIGATGLPHLSASEIKKLDKHLTVARHYNALMVLQQAEHAGVFDRDDRFKKHFAFSHLFTGLGYTGIRRFLGLPIGEKPLEKHNPVPKKHEKQLGELMLWMYGSKQDDRKPLIQSQNPDLRNLDEVLSSEDGIVALRKGLPLRVSLEISKGDERVFREALVEAKQNLQKARGTVLSGYQGNLDLLHMANEVATLIAAVINDMEASMTPKKKRRIGERT